MALSKQKILDEIKRTALENGGKPLGRDKFEKETSIKPYEWEKYWPRFSDAQEEAGLERNQLNVAYSDEFLFEKAIGLMRKLKRFPIYAEFRIERNNDPQFPDKKVFQRWGTKQALAQKVVEYCVDKNGYDDILKLCDEVLKKTVKHEDSQTDNKEMLGEVYLFKSGKYYKIGKTNDTVRRGNELRIQLPEKMDLIHSIKTDDPSGIELYWHRRFDSKRMNGEWFDLNSSEIKAFKRWKRIV
jgi:hypothetical protein